MSWVLLSMAYYRIEYWMSRIRKKMKNINTCSNEDCLSQQEKGKCFQKFESYKALGSIMLSKQQLKKVLTQLGKQATEEELLEMIYEADPHGHGYISLQAFEKMVMDYKQIKEENISNPIGLTYDQMLRCYRASNPHVTFSSLPWTYVELYLQQNFGLKVNLKNFKNVTSKSEITREDFKYIFT